MNTWRYLRVKDMARLGSGSTPKSTNEAYYEDGTYPWLNTSDVQDNVIRHPSFYITDKAIHECSGLREYPKDTLLFAMYGGGTIGNVGLMTFPSRINQACCAMVFHKNFCAKFLFYSFQVHKHKFVSYGFGGSQVNLSQGQISSFGFYIPPLPVQRRIVSYLDSKTSEIDHAISLLEQKREAYTRLKASVINRAVTRGLNPNVKLKDSGVEWIGKIPEGWDLIPLKGNIALIKGKTPNKLTFDNTGVPYLTMDYLRGRDDKTILYPEDSEGLYHIKANEIIVLWDGANAGEFILSKNGYLGSTMAHIEVNNKVYNNEYFYYLMKSLESTSKYFASGTTIPHFDPQILFGRYYPSPSLAEQRSIASYLDAECSKIDRAASIVEKQIDAYKRLKRSLINEVVTGKRKVD